MDGWKLILAGVNLSLLPVMYWFTFLYYTDILATLVVLVMMLLHFHRAPTAAAAMGGCWWGCEEREEGKRLRLLVLS